MPSVGSHNPQAKHAGVFKVWSKFWAKHSGVWKRPISVFVKSSGAWVKVYDERPVITNVTTSYVQDNSDPFFPTTTYYKNFTLSANGHTTTTPTPDPFFPVVYSPAGPFAPDSVTNIATSRAYFGVYDPGNMHGVSATNASGTATA